MAELAFQISKFSQNCVIFHGIPQNTTLHRYTKDMFSPSVGCISEHAKTKMALGNSKDVSTDLNEKLSRKDNISRNHWCCKFPSVEILAPAGCGHLSWSLHVFKNHSSNEMTEKFVLLHLYHTSRNHLKRISIRPPEAESRHSFEEINHHSRKHNPAFLRGY